MRLSGQAGAWVVQQGVSYLDATPHTVCTLVTLHKTSTKDGKLDQRETNAFFLLICIFNDV